jgi:hypothetical protein
MGPNIMRYAKNQAAAQGRPIQIAQQTFAGTVTKSRSISWVCRGSVDQTIEESFKIVDLLLCGSIDRSTPSAGYRIQYKIQLIKRDIQLQHENNLEYHLQSQPQVHS